MPSPKKMTATPSAQKAAPAAAKKATSAVAKKAAASPRQKKPVKPTPPQPLIAQEKTVAQKTTSKAKPKVKGSGIQLLQLTAKGEKSKDPLLKAYQPSAGGMGLSPLLDALCMAQRDPALQKSTVWGLLTPDFTQRTGLTGQDFHNVIEANPGFDLYYASAHPELEAIYHNPWRSPEVTHPEFVALSRRFLKAAGLGDVPVDAISHSSLFATGHLMVASPVFWAQYVGFVETVFSQVQKNLSPSDKTKLFSEVAVPGRMTCLALIVARLLSAFLMLKHSNYRAFKIPLPEQEKTMNTHLRFLREMKDLGLTQKSKWHLAAWVNYRGLYLAHVMGKAWIVKHIQHITPTDLHMALPIAQVHNPYATSLAAPRP
jgi:hypothetical protein